MYLLLQILPCGRQVTFFLQKSILGSCCGFQYSDEEAWTQKVHRSGDHFVQQMIFKTRTRPKVEQGGDWGSFITANLATLFPESLVGLHLNLPPVSPSHCEQSPARHQHQDILYSQ